MGQTDSEILFNSVIASSQNQMYTDTLESCTVLLHLPLQASSLVKSQQSGMGDGGMGAFI